MIDCIFCDIVKGKSQTKIVYEDDLSLTFLDLFPATKGQCLVIPKKHYEYVFDIDDEVYQKLFLTAKMVAKAIDKSLKPVRTCLVVEGFQVPHVHIRLHPSYDLSLKVKPEGKVDSKELERLADKIRKYL